jgi:hypothetical protein
MRKYFLIALVVCFCSWSAMADMTTCVPTAGDENTGSTDGITITDPSEIRGIDTEDGWAKFDVSAVPDADTVTQVDFHFYVNSTNFPYWSTTPVSIDPVGADPATLSADITAEALSGYYNYQNEASTYVPGWKTLTLGGNAVADMNAALAGDAFTVGVATRDSSITYYIVMDGWNQVNVPYLEVTHTGEEVCFFDGCMDAYPISSGELFQGRNCACTDDFQTYSCAPWDFLGPDQVFAIDVACTGAQIDVNCTPTDGWDPAIAIAFECSNGSLVCLAAADTGFEGDPETISYLTTTGEVGTLYIYVDSYYASGGLECGDYDLSVTVDLGIANDLCEDAIPVAVPSVTAGTTECATFDDAPLCVTSQTAPGVWYSVIGSGGMMSASTCGDFYGYDTKLSVYTDGCDMLTCVGGNDDDCPTGASGLLSTVGWDSVMGQEYLILVHGYSTGTGEFDLYVDADMVDTFDVTITCVTPSVMLPGMVSLSVDVTNLTDAPITVSGHVDVTLCNGNDVGPVRTGFLIIPPFETRNISWTQGVTYVSPKTCDCDLIWTVYAMDDATLIEETDACIISTTCPTK